MTRDLGPAPLARCLLVWLTATALLGVLTGWLLPDLLAARDSLTTGPAARFDEVLVAFCELALLTVAGWLWLVTGVVGLDAARGHAHHRRGVPRTLRRLVLVACGAALAGTLTVPSYADPAAPLDAGRGSTALVRGLPLPDRATAAMHVARLLAERAGRGNRPARPSPEPPRSVVVAPGDTLWALAAATLPPQASNADIATRVSLLHRTNRATIGADPDLILPGHVLRLPH